MSYKTQPGYLGDWLKHEYSAAGARHYTREQVTINGTLAAPALATTLLSGAVLGKITATGLVVPINFAAVDGSENAYGLLELDTLVPVTTDTLATAIVRGPAVIIADKITWPAGALAGETAAALLQLAAVGILSETTSV